MPNYSLNPAQKEAVEYANGPLLIVAGAGTGKTSVITGKIAYQINNGLAKPEQILALTFTDKAAEEMIDRVEKLINIGYSDIQISTFHSFGQKILEEYGLNIGLSANFKLANETQTWILLKQNFSKLKLDYYKPIGSPYSHLRELLNHFSKCKDELITPANYLEYAENVKLNGDDAVTEEKSRLLELANAYHTYNQLLANNAMLDFGDLICYSVELLLKRPAIKKRLQTKYKYILVDEFQDVNYAQYQLIKLLAGSVKPSPSQKRGQGDVSLPNLTVVGDDDQSIYAFRGASVSNILHFSDDFPNCKKIILNQNYRSYQPILDLAYKLIQNNNPDRLEVKLNINKKLQAEQKNRGEVEFSLTENGQSEAKFIIDKIVELKQKDQSLVWDDFAILARAGNGAEPIMAALEKSQIPYEFISSTGLYRQPVVLDCFSFLRLLSNQHDSVNFYRLLNLPFLNINNDDLHKLTHFEKKCYFSLFETAREAKFNGISTDAINNINLLVNTIQQCQFLAKTNKPSIVLYNFLEAIGYLKYLITGQEKGDSYQIHQLYHLHQLFKYLYEFEELTPGANVYSFVEHFDSLIESGDKGTLYQPTDTPDSVNILTVHGSKGLEFKNVFLINLVEDRFPSRNRGEGIEMPTELIKEYLPGGNVHLQEERRLLYVGLTRAKENLFLTGAINYGGVKPKKISRFLTELGYLPKASKNNLPTNFQLKPVAGEHNQKIEYKYELPTVFSYSQITSYNTCPYQYKLGHILKIPIKGSAWFSFGQTLHSTLQEFYTIIKQNYSQNQPSLFNKANPNNKTKIPGLKELLTIYDQKWLPDWYISLAQRDEYFANGKRILTDYYKKLTPKPSIPLFMEASFKIKIGNYHLRGRIDRIDELEDKKLHIVDYKTGKPKVKLSLDDKTQLIIYQIAAEELTQFNSLAPLKELSYYYLDDNSEISFLATDEEKNLVKNKLLESIQKIYSNNFYATPSQQTCNYCPFKQICEYKI